MARNALMELLQAASNEAAGAVSAPVDLLSWGLRKAGVPVPTNALLGSDWMAQQGLTKPVQSGVPQVAGATLGLLSPVAAAARAPQIARGLLQAGENAAAPRTLGTQRGIFMGDLSKTWDKAAAQKAQALEKAGADPRAIWQETGAFKGADGKWRQEIDDSAAALTERAQRVFTPGVVNADRTFDAMLPDAMTHKAFTDAYPLSIGVKATNDPTGGASFMSGPSPFSKDGLYRTVQMSKGTQEPRSTLLHELQHAVQDHQGFARGGSPGSGSRAPFVYGGPADKRMKEIEGLLDSAPYESSAYKQLADEYQTLRSRSEAEAALEGYRRLAGEAEARAVEKRMNLTAQQRRALFPFDSYDVPINSLIVR